MNKLFPFALVIFLVCVFSCSKKEVHKQQVYTPEEFTAIIEPLGVAIDKETKRAINFADYAPGVNRINSKSLLYERLHFYAIEFENENQAHDEAKRLNQYYSRNWLFDKVEGEPILEDLIIVKFHAKNPNKLIARKPIHIPHAKSSHSGSEGSAPSGH